MIFLKEKNEKYFLCVTCVNVHYWVNQHSCHCGDAEKHAADKTKEEKKEKDKDA